MEKMELLNELWRLNIRAEAHLGSDFQMQDLNPMHSNIKLLVTFKKAVYVNTKKVKVKDFEHNTEKDVLRDQLTDLFKQRFKSQTLAQL